MKKIFGAAAFVALTAGSVFAADIAAQPYSKAPVYTVPVYDWSGFYIGVDVGGVSQSDSGISNFFQVGNSRNLLTQSSSSGSLIGGGHIGYNWQFAPTWVLGIEADAQWMNAKNNFCRGLDGTLTSCIDTNRGFATIESETKWLSTVRGRLGWTFDRFMIYGTGGVAFGEIETKVGFSCLVAGCAAAATPLATAGTDTSTRAGWVAGAGIEWMVASNWMIRAEYLHVDLGSVTGNVLLPATTCIFGGPCGMSYSRDLIYDMGRVGLSYKFGGPVVAKY